MVSIRFDEMNVEVAPRATALVLATHALPEAVECAKRSAELSVLRVRFGDGAEWGVLGGDQRPEGGSVEKTKRIGE